MGDQEIQKRPHARRQMRALANIDGMDVFGLAGVVILQDGNESTRLQIGAHLKLGQQAREASRYRPFDGSEQSQEP